MIGSSPAFLEMLESISRYARHERPVLVMGERGTGKEEVASRLHYLSPRWQQNLVKLNCAATNENLPELARKGRFREDLLDRLAFDVVAIPPLRARQEDVLLLANHFAVRISHELGEIEDDIKKRQQKCWV
ncbi:sigma 54-interacting transcriptional regulator [Endozoicomonas sp. ALB115]|uniref:sigma 54-interacting transcriptional regulator n=1 Tax=Endozoicomonas sp. ALB115 TaxID=3403074 RepID=UPI003BB609E7